MAAALQLAHNADVIVFVGGLDVTNVEREGHDRHDIHLPGLQPKLLASLLALGKPLALVLFHGGVVTLPPSILAHSNLAVVSAGYPGIHGGKAIAEALFDAAGVGDGKASNRWGRTAVTWYSEAGWQQAGYDMLSFDMAAAPGRTYRYYNGLPQWPFGFGLSYSTLKLHAVHSNATDASRTGRVAVGVENVDPSRSSDAVVLLYIQPHAGTVPTLAPAAALRRQLVAFERLAAIPAADQANFAFELTPEHVSLHDAHGATVLYPGLYELIVSLGDGEQSNEVTLHFSCDGKSGCQSA